jgi:hypothetical protein
MNLMIGRTVLAALLIMTVAGKLHVSAGPSPEPSFSQAVMRVLQAHGLQGHRRNWSARDVLHTTIEFQAPGCDRTIEIIPIEINLQAAPLFDLVVEPGYTTRFAYLDRTWPLEDRMGMRSAWLRNKALSILGLGRFVTLPTGLLIAEPPGCEVGKIDWSLVWDRRTLAGG